MPPLPTSTYEGMGTTVVAACVKDGSVVFGNVGDSRIYRDARWRAAADHGR